MRRSIIGVAILCAVTGAWADEADDNFVPEAVVSPAPPGANTLTDAEKADGWRLAWDGVTTEGWVSVRGYKKFPSNGWVIKDGVLTVLPKMGISRQRKRVDLPEERRKRGGGGDIVTARKFKDFAFKFDFCLTPAANSGVKYFYDERQNGRSAEEYQILENGHPDSRNPSHKAAALYDLIAANADEYLKPAGEWNTGMIVSKGAHVEHWLNGRKVVEYERGSEAFRAQVAKSKYRKGGKDASGNPQPWGEIPEGRILLQDHVDSTVGFCNLKIKEF